MVTDYRSLDVLMIITELAHTHTSPMSICGKKVGCNEMALPPRFSSSRPTKLRNLYVAKVVIQLVPLLLELTADGSNAWILINIKS